MPLAPLLTLLLLPGFAAGPPPDNGWEPPDKAETAFFAKLQKRFTAYAPGEPVEDVLRSLSEPVRVDMGCRRVITVRTRLKHWRGNGEKDAWYEWGGVSNGTGTEGGASVESFVNVIAFDAAAMGDERSRRSKVDSTATFYHELLHGQLLLNAMKGDAAWRKAYCADADIDFSPADLGDPHQLIPALENAYRDGLWNAVKDAKSFD